MEIYQDKLTGIVTFFYFSVTEYKYAKKLVNFDGVLVNSHSDFRHYLIKHTKRLAFSEFAALNRNMRKSSQNVTRGPYGRLSVGWSYY